MRSVLPTLRTAMHEHYHVNVITIRRLWSGTTAVHARAETSTGTLFVKTYPRHIDSAYELLNIEVAQQWADGGIPGAQPVPTSTGRLLHSHGGITMSVWQWVDGQPPAHLTRATAGAIGDTMARLHRFLDNLDLPTLPINREYARTAPAEQIRTRFQRMHTHLCDLPGRAEHTMQVARRLQQLAELEQLRGPLAKCTLARVHGDVAAPNLLFTGNTLTAVIDPRVQLADRARELGRIAVDPHTVATQADWPTIALDCVGAYLNAGGPLTADQITSSIRLALLHSLTSTYPVEDGLARTEPARVRTQQTRYWANRCTAVDRILPVLPDLEHALAQRAAVAGRPMTAVGGRP